MAYLSTPLVRHGRIRHFVASMFSITFLFCITLPGTLHGAELNVVSAILVDAASGKILYEQNADAPIPPASLTKVLSMYIALDHVKNGKISLRDNVKISPRAARTGGSRMFLKAGETVSFDELLTGMAVSSGNDASVAVAEHVAGSTSNFVQLMNNKARSLGMGNSVFRNVHGLPSKGQMTSARDMMKLARSYLNMHPQALRYHSTCFIKHNKVITTNKNPMLGNCEGADGLKTGWVNASGYNLISTVKRGPTRLIAVVLGAENSHLRGQEMNRLVEAGFKTLRGEGPTVSALLPKLSPHDYRIDLRKTNALAYAEVSKNKKATNSSRKFKARKGKDKTQVARNGKASRTVKTTKESGKSTAAVSKSATSRRTEKKITSRKSTKASVQAARKASVSKSSRAEKPHKAKAVRKATPAEVRTAKGTTKPKPIQAKQQRKPEPKQQAQRSSKQG